MTQKRTKSASPLTGRGNAASVRTNAAGEIPKARAGEGAGDAARRARARRAVRRRRQRRKYILLLLILLLLLGMGVASLAYLRRGGSFLPLEEAYASSREFAGGSSDKDNLRAKSFAADLCVVGGNVPLEGVSLPQDQQGLLLDVADGRTLYAKDALTRVYPASITKMVTAMLALEYGNLRDIVVISAEDLNLEEGSQVCGFRVGDKLTMDQLLHCLLVYSGNDAAMAIADHVGGDVDTFVSMMNSYAARLGCTGTHFMNPHGLQNENHYTTPYDIYLILKEAAKFPEFTEISQLGTYTVEYSRSDGTIIRTILEATDHYLTGEATLPKDVTVLGGKTGTTSNAGNCLALLTQNAFGKPYVSVVMGAPTKDDLYVQMNTLLAHINDP